MVASVVNEGKVRRHALSDRLFHWVQAICMFVLLGTSLLPVLGVQFAWVTIHWIAGLVLTASVVLHIIRVTFWKRLGTIWIGFRDLRDLRDVAAAVFDSRKQEPKPGKYTFAQKGFHNFIAVVLLVAIVTGIVLMFGVDTPFWETDPYVVSEANRGLLFVLHGLTALLSVTLIMLHIYFAIRPEKLFYTRSMILGWITRGEYQAHHDSSRWSDTE
ncbi:MAG: cytochrome b/b6 domain-containing protein [Gammaproteobacteria bacterium]